MKILIIGPFSPPITGNSFANDTLFEGIKKNNIKVDKINFAFPTLKEDLGKITSNKVIHYLSLYIQTYKIFSSDRIYITTGQTFFGVLKYYPFIFLAKALRKDLTLHVHGNHLKTEYQNLNGFKKNLIYKIISKFNKGIVLSDNLRPNLSPFIERDKIFTVYNFVDQNILKKTSLKDIRNKKTDVLKIVFFSNLMREKGIFDFLKSLEILKRKDIQFKARIAGAMDSVNEDKIKKLIEDLGEDVKYSGIVKDDDKLDLLLKSNIFVLPTYYAMEGQPISILEAMATGNIILTTNHAGIPDIFKNEKNGLYINKQDPKDIADKLEYISKNFNSTPPIMKNNFLEASQNYTSNRFIDNIIKIILK